MSIILNIDTAVETASICLAENGAPFAFEMNPSQKDHAAWLQPAIRSVLNRSGLAFSELAAIAVSIGPGSYTGLRVGLATAKGLCFSLKTPLITINTLKMMAFAAKSDQKAFLLCPLIDARRLEVFAAIYDHELNEILPPHNLILDETAFRKQLADSKILFFGNGSAKFRQIVNNNNALFAHVEASAKDLALLSSQMLQHGDFADLAYAEPFYGKEFYSPVKHSS